MNRERNEQGQFVGTVNDEAVLAAVRAVAPAPATASDVADKLGCTRKAAWEHLTALHGDGAVNRKKVGGRSVVWWLPSDEAAVTGIDPEDGFWRARPGSSPEPTDGAKTDEYLADALTDG